MPVTAISQWPEAYCRKKLQNCFTAGNEGKLSASNVNGLSPSVLGSWRLMDVNKPHNLA
jgi:hypothetical protein